MGLATKLPLIHGNFHGIFRGWDDISIVHEMEWAAEFLRQEGWPSISWAWGFSPMVIQWIF